eukprot:1195104-Prorocentrum_minimum.AAC.2
MAACPYCHSAGHSQESDNRGEGGDNANARKGCARVTRVQRAGRNIKREGEAIGGDNKGMPAVGQNPFRRDFRAQTAAGCPPEGGVGRRPQHAAREGDRGAAGNRAAAAVAGLAGGSAGAGGCRKQH